MFTLHIWFTTVIISGMYTVSGKCTYNAGTTAALMEKELRDFDKKSILNFTLYGLNTEVLYDKGDVLQWNCTDDKNQSSQQNTSPSQTEQAATHLSTVTVEGSADGSDPFFSSSRGNITRPNTYVLVYKNVFGRRRDENPAPSINLPVKILRNSTSEDETAMKPAELTEPVHTTGGSELKLEESGNEDESLGQPSNKNSSLGQESNVISPLSPNNPVKILLGEKHGITILNTSNPENSIFLNKTDIDAFGIDYKYSTNTIFFARNGEIRSTGKPTLVVSAGVDGPVRLAVDWVHDRLYWLSDQHQTVEAANLDGSNRTVLIDVISNVKFPNNIAVDPYDESIFFAANHSMYRASLDGRDLLRYNLQNRTVRCLALDIQARRLYFSGKSDNPSRPYIASCDYDGRSVRYHDIGNTDWNDVFSMDVFRDVVYFAHFNPQASDSIWAFNTSWSGKRPVNVYAAPAARGGIWSIKVFHSEIQKQSD